MEARARSGGWSREQYEQERLDLILRARNARTSGGSPDGGSGDSPPTAGDDQVGAAEALGRALDALENRSRSGGWSRETFERERLDLIVRARGLDLGVPADEAEPQQARSRAAAALARALDALADRARNAGWRREQYEHERLDLILRARAARERKGEEPPPSPPADPRSEAAKALVRGLDALEDRARSGGWSREQYEKGRLDLILRARGVDLGSGDEAARSEAARALTRALDAMKDRARSGGWTREQYERQRIDLIQRAAGTRREDAGSGGGTVEEPTPDRSKGIEVKRIGGAKEVKRVPAKEKASGAGEGGDAERRGDPERGEDGAERKAETEREGREDAGPAERPERSGPGRRGG